MVATVLRDMTALLEQFESTHDRRAVFLDCYRRMTSAMVTELEEDRFDDARFVRTLLTRFAGYYFDAVDRWEHGDVSTPMPWQLALDATRDEHTDSPRLLLAGVNAHINHDLVLPSSTCSARNGATPITTTATVAAPTSTTSTG